MSKKIGPGAKARYRAAHPVISLQLTKKEYDSLDRIRKVEGIGWADIMRRSLQVPSTEEGKFTMERCLAAEGKIKVLEAQLKNSVSSRLVVNLCNAHGFCHSFNLGEAKDKARVESILYNAIRVDMPCPMCGGRHPAYGRR